MESVAVPRARGGGGGRLGGPPAPKNKRWGGAMGPAHALCARCAPAAPQDAAVFSALSNEAPIFPLQNLSTNLAGRSR